MDKKNGCKERELTHSLVMERVALWAQNDENIRGAAVIGSRARKEKRADKWSDLDLIICAKDPGLLLEREEWIIRFGPPLMTFIEKTPLGGRERRVLYENGVDVDFACLSPEEFLNLKKNRDVLSLFVRGYSVLVDKERLFDFPDVVVNISMEKPVTKEGLLQLVNDFYFHAVWTAKKVSRGELWEALICCDGHMKGLLLEMIRLYTGPEKETWHSARFVELWAPDELKLMFREIFASYGYEEIQKALYHSMDLFSKAGRKVFCSYGLPWPEHICKGAMRLVEACFRKKEP
ncbi:aminoglycoside 6-adenylyltransferase [Candidatus Mcinerneyibacteriota bacterium]|nr:aminoglycoside 6-adenylyltransferase [Candidatus Mcinerneyibacteriota bacterium]